MDRFEVGDRAEIIYAAPEYKLIGRHCTIVTPLHDDAGFPSHTIDIDGGPLSPTGKPWSARPSELRKLRPPTTTWSECAEFTDWNPEKVPA